MHEYRLEDKVLTQKNVPQDTYVLCVLFKKDGPGPRNGAQYGAPFKDEDWSDEDVPATNGPTILHGETSLVVASSLVPTKDCFGGMVSESCVSEFVPATSDLPQLNGAANTPMSAAPLLDSNSTASLAPPTLEAPTNNYDDLYSMLDLFVDDDEFLRFPEPNNNEIGRDANVYAPICLGEGEYIFSELPDFSNMQHNSMQRAPSYDLIENSELYLELQDLTAPLAPPQNGNASDSYLSNQDQFDFSTAGNDEDPYGFSASMGQGPDM
ncbi:unnamed protein product [Brassica oleracea]